MEGVPAGDAAADLARAGGGDGLAFALSFDEFIITFFVIGPESTLPMFIWSSLRRTVDPSINVVSTVLLASRSCSG